MTNTIQNGVEIEWCCETLDQHLTNNRYFVLGHSYARGGLLLKITTVSEMLHYCPFCGTKVNILSNTSVKDELIEYRGMKAKLPGDWEEL